MTTQWRRVQHAAVVRLLLMLLLLLAWSATTTMASSVHNATSPRHDGERDVTPSAPSHNDVDNVRRNNRHSDRGDAARPHGLFMPAAAASSRRDAAASAASSSSSSECERVVHDYLARLHDTAGTLSKTAHEAKEMLQHARKGDASAVKDAGHVVQSAMHALKSTEADAKAMLGRDVPQVCIDEVQKYVNALPAIVSTNEVVRTWTHYYRLLTAHARTFYYVMRGIARYTLSSGGESAVVRAMHAFNATYAGKAKALYDELNAHTGVRGVLRGGHDASEAIRPARLKKQAQAAVYTIAPYAVYALAAVAAVVAAPLVLLYAVFGHGFYHTWLKLFVLFFHYGHTSPVRALRSFGHVGKQLMSGDWAAAASTATDAFLGMASGTDKSYYSGYLMLFVLAIAAVATVAASMVWWRGVRAVWRRMMAGMYTTAPYASSTRQGDRADDDSDRDMQRRSSSGGSAAAASQRPSRSTTEKKQS